MKDTRTDQELNKIIAEWMGWLRMIRMGKEVYYDPEGGHVFPHKLPDYCSDLNAIHEAVYKCNDSQCKLWVNNLEQILRSKLRDEGVHQWPDDFSRHNALARQRAEALVSLITKS